MKTTDLIAKMDAALGVLSNTRVTDFTMFHMQVHALLTPIIQPLGLQYTAWEVKTIDEFRTLFALRIDFKNDANCRNGSRRGRLHRAYTVQTTPGTTVQHAIALHELNSVDAAVTAQHSHILMLENQLTESRNRMYKLLHDKAALNSKCGGFIHENVGCKTETEAKP